MKKLILFFGVIAILSFGGCAQPSEGGTAEGTGEGTALSAAEQAKLKCTELCAAELAKGTDLSNGPCLSDDNPEWEISDWVCDVAHSPRAVVDNQRENQCNEWHSGAASHFVEVTPECELIRTV